MQMFPSNADETRTRLRPDQRGPQGQTCRLASTAGGRILRIFDRTDDGMFGRRRKSGASRP